MAITTVMFDLDGTLLPMDLDAFLSCYFQLLVKKLAPYGYEPKALTKGIWAGVAAMVSNNGSRTNEQAFWDTLTQVMGVSILSSRPIMEEFYQTEFQQAQAVCGFTPDAAKIVRLCKEKGLRVVLATSPLYPRIGTESRVRWAGLQPEDFNYITTFEDSRYCKPNPDYYREILSKLQLTPEECLMVGNDVTEDMGAEDVGMQVFLLPACLINKENKDITRYPQGGFHDLEAYIDKIIG